MFFGFDGPYTLLGIIRAYGKRQGIVLKKYGIIQTGVLYEMIKVDLPEQNTVMLAFLGRERPVTVPVLSNAVTLASPLRSKASSVPLAYFNL
jgi:hypothetical protein